MTELLVRAFIKDHKNTQSPTVRRSYGTMASLVGIVLNVLLFVGKFIAGTLSGAISMVADAINNLSDAASQIISFISFKISAKPADRAHPFGHARIEYIASMVVSFLILIIGYELLSESIMKIIEPHEIVFSIISVVILSASILVKLWLFFFNRKIAKKIDSSVMKATALDSLSDAGATFAVLVSLLIFKFTGITLDAYMGVAVAVLIFVAGIKILIEAKNAILGEAPSEEVVDNIRSLVMSYPEAIGIHDLVVHNYGPSCTMATLHVEVDGAKNVFDTHDAIDNMEKALFIKHGIHATIHLDPIVTDDEQVNSLREKVSASVAILNSEFKIHDFRFVSGNTHSNLIFDIAVPFEEKRSDGEIKELVSDAISKIDNTYFAVLTIDRE